MIFNKKTAYMNYCNIFQGIMRSDNLSLERNQKLIDAERSLILDFSQGAKKDRRLDSLVFKIMRAHPRIFMKNSKGCL
jgi:hypothetical protein